MHKLCQSTVRLEPNQRNTLRANGSVTPKSDCALAHSASLSGGGNGPSVESRKRDSSF
jgi:hypothetical protein